MRLMDFRITGRTFYLSESAGYYILKYKEMTMKSCLKKSVA